MKYKPLANFLQDESPDIRSLSFVEIERIVGSFLPPSARKHKAWWSNNPTGDGHARAWIDSGYRIARVDLSSETATFRRMNVVEKLQRHPAFGGLAGTVRVMPGVDLTKPADPDWGKVYD